MIPPKLHRGDPIGKLFNHWNMLIDYLHEIRLVSGSGISVSRKTAGTVINVKNISGSRIGQTQHPGGFIRGINCSGAVIPANTFVTIGSFYRGDTQGEDAVLEIRPGVADPCGVVTEACLPGKITDVQVSGLADHVKAPLPCDIQVAAVYYEDEFAVILGSCGNDLYRNFFKVSAMEFNGNSRILKLRIYDGGDPQSDCCGLTDAGTVSCEELAAGGGKYICLRLVAEDSHLHHKFEILHAPPEENEPVVILAEIVRRYDGEKVVQRWTGGMIHWRDRFVIPFGR